MHAPPAPYSGSFDWLQPPFAGGRSGAHLALQPVAEERWLTAAKDNSVSSYKRTMHRLHGAACGAVWSEPAAAQWLQQGERCLGELLDRAQIATAALAPEEAKVPLMAAALSIHEDLCLMARRGSDYRLVAANLCMPSYWSLASKLGESLGSIHQPVADLDTGQLQRMGQLFEGLPGGRVFERRNWFLHGSDRGFEPGPDVTDYSTYEGRWFLRSERQSLRRLNADLVLFGIRVDIEPLSRISQYPQAHADLRLALQRLSGSALVDFGGAAKCAAALRILGALTPAS